MEETIRTATPALGRVFAGCLLTAGLALTAPPCQADGPELVDTGTGGNEFSLHWSSIGTNTGYAVASCDSLIHNAWSYAGDVDQWPTADTNWIDTIDTDQRFYRVQATQRGKLLASRHQNSLSLLDLFFLLQSVGITNITPSYGVAVYDLTYLTFDHRGLSTTATGALAVPVGASSAPLLSYQHGTIFEKHAAPSVPYASEQGVGVAFASEGYVVTMPDYLGMGTNSPALHPYIHARSEAVACLDMIRAARTFVSNNLPFALTGQLFLMGYSQGGQATLALQREIESYHTNELPLTASAPMAGPYDLSGTMTDALMSPVPYPDPAYLAYLLFGYNGVYGLFEDPSDVLASPYDSTLPPLMDGEHSSSSVNAAMPAIPQHIFTPAYLDALTNDTNHPFRVALRANDLVHWTPQTPTRLYHASGDTVVPYQNSQVAYSNFTANGAPNIDLIDVLPGGDHDDGAVPAFILAKAWFDSLRLP